MNDNKRQEIQSIKNGITSLNGIGDQKKELDKLDDIEEIFKHLCDEKTITKIKDLIKENYNKTNLDRIPDNELDKQLFERYVEQFAYLLAHKSFECNSSKALVIRKKLLTIISGTKDINVKRCLLHSIFFSLGNNKEVIGDGLSFKASASDDPAVDIDWSLVAIGGLYQGDLMKLENHQINLEAKLFNKYIAPRSLDKKTQDARQNILGLLNDKQKNKQKENLSRDRTIILTKTIQSLDKNITNDTIWPFIYGDDGGDIIAKKHVYDQMKHLYDIANNEDAFKEYICNICNIDDNDALNENYNKISNELQKNYKELGIPEKHKDNSIKYLQSKFKEMFFKYGRARDEEGKLLILKIINEQKQQEENIDNLITLIKPLFVDGIIVDKKDINEILSHLELKKVMALCDNNSQMLSDYLHSFLCTDLQNKINTLNYEQKNNLLEILEERKDLSSENNYLANIIKDIVDDQMFDNDNVITERLFLAAKNGSIKPNTLEAEMLDVSAIDSYITFAKRHNTSCIDLYGLLGEKERLKLLKKDYNVLDSFTVHQFTQDNFNLLFDDIINYNSNHVNISSVIGFILNQRHENFEQYLQYANADNVKKLFTILYSNNNKYKNISLYITKVIYSCLVHRLTANELSNFLCNKLINQDNPKIELLLNVLSNPSLNRYTEKELKQIGKDICNSLEASRYSGYITEILSDYLKNDTNTVNKDVFNEIYRYFIRGGQDVDYDDLDLSKEDLQRKSEISTKLHKAVSAVQQEGKIAQENLTKTLLDPTNKTDNKNSFLLSVLNNDFKNAKKLLQDDSELLFQDHDGLSILDVIGEANNPKEALEFLLIQHKKYKKQARNTGVGDFIAQNTDLLEGIDLNCLGNVNDLAEGQLSDAIANSLKNNNYRVMTQYLAKHNNFSNTLSNTLQEEKGKELLRQTDQKMVNFVAGKTQNISKVLLLANTDRSFVTPALPPLSKPNKSLNSQEKSQEKPIDLTVEERKNLSLDEALGFYRMGHTSEATVIMKVFSRMFSSSGREEIDFDSEDMKSLKTSKSGDSLIREHGYSKECDPFNAFALFFNGSEDHIARLKDIEKLTSRYLNFLPDEDKVFANYRRGKMGTPLHIALMTCNASLALTLLTDDSNKTNIGKIKSVNEIDKWEQNAFHAIAIYSHQQLGVGDQVKSERDQLLILDALLNHASSPHKVIELLRQKNHDGDTPVESAIKHGNTAFVKRISTYLVDNVEKDGDRKHISYILDAKENGSSLFNLSSMYGLGNKITSSLLELLGITEKHYVDFNIKSLRDHLTIDSANRLLQYYEDTHEDRILNSDSKHVQNAIDNYGVLIEKSAELGVPFFRLKSLLNILIQNGDIEREEDLGYESGNDDENAIELQSFNNPDNHLDHLKQNKNFDHILSVAKSIFKQGSPRDICDFLDYYYENKDVIAIPETTILQHLSLTSSNPQKLLEHYLNIDENRELQQSDITLKIFLCFANSNNLTNDEITNQLDNLYNEHNNSEITATIDHYIDNNIELNPTLFKYLINNRLLIHNDRLYHILCSNINNLKNYISIIHDNENIENDVITDTLIFHITQDPCDTETIDNLLNRLVQLDQGNIITSIVNVFGNNDERYKNFDAEKLRQGIISLPGTIEWIDYMSVPFVDTDHAISYIINGGNNIKLIDDNIQITDGYAEKLLESFDDINDRLKTTVLDKLLVCYQDLIEDGNIRFDNLSDDLNKLLNKCDNYNVNATNLSKIIATKYPNTLLGNKYNDLLTDAGDRILQYLHPIGAFITDENPPEIAYLNLKDRDIIEGINGKARKLIDNNINLEELSNLYVYDINNMQKISMVDYILSYGNEEAKEPIYQSVEGENTLKDDFIEYLKRTDPSVSKTQMYLKILVDDYKSGVGYTDGVFNTQLITGNNNTLTEIKKYISTDDGMNMLLDRMEKQRCNLDNIKDFFANLDNTNPIDGIDENHVVRLCVNMHLRYPKWNLEEIIYTICNFVGDNQFNLDDIQNRINDELIQRVQVKENTQDTRCILEKIVALDELTSNTETIKKKSSALVVLSKKAMENLNIQRELFVSLLSLRGSDKQAIQLSNDLKNQIANFQNHPELLFSGFDCNGANVTLLPLLKESSTEILAEIYNKLLCKHMPFNVFVKDLNKKQTIDLYNAIENRDNILLTEDISYLKDQEFYSTIIEKKLKKYNDKIGAISKLIHEQGSKKDRKKAIENTVKYSNIEIELVLKKEIRTELQNSINEVYGGNTSLKNYEKLKELLKIINSRRLDYKNASGENLMTIAMQEYNDIYNKNNNGLVHSDSYSNFIKTILFACTNSTEFTKQNVEYLMRDGFITNRSPIEYIFTHPQGSKFIEELLNATKQNEIIKELLDYNTLVGHAISNNNIDALEVILKSEIFKGHNLNSLNSHGQPPLFVALHFCLNESSNTSTEMLERLINYGADYNILDSTGKNLVQCLLDEVINNRQQLDNKTIELLQYLISRGISLSIKDKNGVNALDRIEEIHDSYEVLNKDYQKLSQKKGESKTLSSQEERRLSEHEKTKDVYRNAIELYETVFDNALESCKKRNEEIDSIVQCLQIEGKALASSYRSGFIARTRNIKLSNLNAKSNNKSLENYSDIVNYSRSGNGVLTLKKSVDKKGKLIYISSDKLIDCLEKDGNKDCSYSSRKVTIDFGNDDSVEIERKVINSKRYYNYVPTSGIVTISFKGPEGNLLKISIDAKTGNIDLYDLRSKKIISDNSRIKKAYKLFLENSPIFICGISLVNAIEDGQIKLKSNNTRTIDLTAQRHDNEDDIPFQSPPPLPSLPEPKSLPPPLPSLPEPKSFLRSKGLENVGSGNVTNVADDGQYEIPSSIFQPPSLQSSSLTREYENVPLYTEPDNDVMSTSDGTTNLADGSQYNVPSSVLQSSSPPLTRKSENPLYITDDNDKLPSRPPSTPLSTQSPRSRSRSSSE